MSLNHHVKIDAILKDPRLTLEDTQVINQPRTTPAQHDIILSKDMCPNDHETIIYMMTKPYKSMVGTLLYLAITTRPDIAPAVSAVGRYAQNPGRQHWDAILRILAYLKGSAKLSLE
jgi:hypothetical protein